MSWHSIETCVIFLLWHPVEHSEDSYQMQYCNVTLYLSLNSMQQDNADTGCLIGDEDMHKCLSGLTLK